MEIVNEIRNIRREVSGGPIELEVPVGHPVVSCQLGYYLKLRKEI